MVIDDGYITSDDSTIDMVIVSSIIDETIDFLKKGLDLIGKNFTEYMCINELWHLFDDKYFILGVMHVSLTELLDYFGVGLTEEEKKMILYHGTVDEISEVSLKHYVWSMIDCTSCAFYLCDKKTV